MVTSPHPIFSARVGGRLSLDFVNTVRARAPRGPGTRAPDFQDVLQGERLTDYAALLEWATWTGVLGRAEARRLAARAGAHPRDAVAAHARAIGLREATYRLGKASLEGWPPLSGDLEVLTREVQAARSHQVLDATPRALRNTGAAAYRVAWTPAPVPLDRPLWDVALDAAALLTGDQLHRLGQCPAVGCGWLFLDTSRTGRRQWCDMAVCGNAEKVRRFRERARARRRVAAP